MQIKKPLFIIILAAGKGKRMNNPDLPKVMVEVNGKPLLAYVLEESYNLNPDKVIVVIGHKKEVIENHFNKAFYKNLDFVYQNEQLGTGHAVEQARNLLEGKEGDTLILLGDVPLLKSSTLENFIQDHYSNKSSLSVLSAITLNPHGYGRIVRNAQNEFIQIKEHKDANKQELSINEINSGVFLVDNEKLFESLGKISNNNAQGEYYLTDIVEVMKNNEEKVFAFNSASFDELQGINSPEDLERIEKYLNM